MQARGPRTRVTVWPDDDHRSCFFRYRCGTIDADTLSTTGSAMNTTRPLLVLVLAGASFLAAQSTGQRLFFHLSYILAALPLVALIWTWLNLYGLSIEREHKSLRASVGEYTRERLTIRNRWWLPKLWIEVQDESDLPNHEPGFVAYLGAREITRWTTRTLCTHRGRFRLGPTRIISSDPFGLFRFSRLIAGSGEIIVYPPTDIITGFRLPGTELAGGSSSLVRTYTTTPNVATIRDYQPGDSLNRIHWRSTARRDRLIVKEFELDPLSELWVILDLNAAAHVARPFDTGGVAPNEVYLPPDSAEYAIAVAASISAHFLIKERSLGFSAYTPQRNLLPPDRGGRQLTRILEALALAKVESDLPFAHQLALTSPQLARGAIAILISADMDDAWLAEAQLLVRRGVRVIAVLIDPHSFGVATESRRAAETRACLEIGGVTTYLVRYGDNLSAALSRANLHLPSRPALF